MKPRNFKYFIKQGVAGIMSNWFMSIASVSIVVASLLIFGSFIILGLNFGYMVDQIEEQCQINVYIPKDSTDEEFKAIGKSLANVDNVKSVQYYSKEERYEKWSRQNEFDESSVEMLEKDNPLRDSYILTLDDPQKAGQVIKDAAKVKGVEEVKDSLALINKIVSITNTVKTVIGWLLLILVIVSVFIISNTIKIGLFARRKEINIMKFVGATNWFIRWPFIVEGILLGCIGAILSATVIIFSYEMIIPGLSEFFGSIKILQVKDVYNYVVWGFIGLGSLIGLIGSYTSIRKHLHV